MASNNGSVGEEVADEECDVHAQVLLAVHQEFLDYGLIPQQQQQQQRVIQSAAGAFPPLRYGDAGGGGRVVVLRALAMFDDLIVNVTAASPRADDCDGGEGEVVSRRIKLNVLTWSPLFPAAGLGVRKGSGLLHRQMPQQGDGQTAPPVARAAAAGAAAGAGRGEERGGAEGGGATTTSSSEEDTDAGTETSGHTLAPAAAARASPSPSAVSATAATTATPDISPSRETFRSRVLSGLLLHLFPPPGHFADLFGCGDELRQRILGLLGARDLATFGLTSRSSAVNAVSNPLWAPLLRADFSESEQREGAALTLPPLSSLDRSYHRRKCGRSSANGGDAGSGGGGNCGDAGGQEEGRLWRCYGELERRRQKREARRRARVQERSRAMQLLAFMGRRSRAPYPAGLPRGPYHTPGPPVFPGYDWGPGIGEGADVSPLSPPSSMWGRGGWPTPLRGWGRAPWRR